MHLLQLNLLLPLLQQDERLTFMAVLGLEYSLVLWCGFSTAWGSCSSRPRATNFEAGFQLAYELHKHPLWCLHEP